MKKLYKKPTMDSELFVANEYIAQCWNVTCIGVFGYNSHGSFNYKGKEPTADASDEDGFFRREANGQWYYTGVINNHPASDHPIADELLGRGHPITYNRDTDNFS